MGNFYQEVDQLARGLLARHPRYSRGLPRLESMKGPGESLASCMERLGLIKPDGRRTLEAAAKGYLDLPESADFLQSVDLPNDAAAPAPQAATPAAAPAREAEKSSAGVDGAESFSDKMLKRRIGSGVRQRAVAPEIPPRLPAPRPLAPRSSAPRQPPPSGDAASPIDQTQPTPPRPRLSQGEDRSGPTSISTAADLLASWEPREGAMLGHARLEKMLGHGSSATVWKAWNENLRIPVAVKILKNDQQGSAFRDGFLAEARAIAGLNHPHVVRVFHCGEHGGRLFIEEEFIGGMSLGAIVRTVGSISLTAALEATLGAVMGLAHAHRKGLAHRDVKPDNIMVTAQGEIKLTDFGQAELVGDAEAPSADEPGRPRRQLAGSPAYMAPELLSPSPTAGPASDIYALGVTLFQLVAGELPFKAQTVLETLRMHVSAPPPSLAERLPKAASWLDDLFRRMVAKDPATRYNNYGALALDLRHALLRSGDISAADTLGTDDFVSVELGALCAKLQSWWD